MSHEIAVISESSKFLDTLSQLAVNPDVDPTKLHVLLDVQERILTKKAEQEFNEAFQRLRGKLPIIKKGDVVEYPVNKNNPDGPKKEAFKFAKWEKVQAIIDDIIAEEGFDLTFDSEIHTNGTSTIAILHHVGGHTRRTSTPPIPIDSSGGKNNVQGIGSSMSYGQRYATKFALNLRFEDDDDGHKGGMVFISDAQVANINNLLEETKANKDAFLQMMGVVAVENITTEQCDRALNALIAKKRKMGAAS